MYPRMSNWAGFSPRLPLLSRDGRLCAARAMGAAIDTLALRRSLLLDLSDQQPGRFGVSASVKSR